MESIDFSLVIDFLEKEIERLVKQIKIDNGSDQSAIDLKAQMHKAIKSLRLCEEYQIDNRMTFKVIEEGGSEAYFTDFYLVDESKIDKINEEAIKTHQGLPLIVSCFDLIGLRK